MWSVVELMKVIVGLKRMLIVTNFFYDAQLHFSVYA